MTPVRPPSAASIIAAWEKGRGRHPIDRAVLLHALAQPGADPDSLADEPLGRRNAALLGLRLASFGRRAPAYLDCPHCGARLQLEVDAATLLPAAHGGEATVEVEGRTFRPPTSRDLAAILEDDPPERAAVRLLRRCLVPPSDLADDAQLEALLESVEAELERADPCAELTLDVCCDACTQAWSAPFDIAAFLWEEIEAHAARLLDDVHVLARAYGWSESAILALSDARRAAYLDRVTT